MIESTIIQESYEGLKLGLLAPSAKEKCLPRSNPRRKTKGYLTVEWGPCPKSYRLYEVAIPIDSTRSILGKYALGYCIVVSAMPLSA